jgi:hypothetical protein
MLPGAGVVPLAAGTHEFVLRGRPSRAGRGSNRQISEASIAASAAGARLYSGVTQCGGALCER